MSTRIRVKTENPVVIIILTRKWVKMMTEGTDMDYSQIYVRRIRKLCK